MWLPFFGCSLNASLVCCKFCPLLAALNNDTSFNNSRKMSPFHSQSVKLSPFPGSTRQSFWSSLLCGGKKTRWGNSGWICDRCIEISDFSHSSYKADIITINDKFGQLSFCSLLLFGFLSRPSLDLIGRIQLPTHDSKNNLEMERKSNLYLYSQNK